MENDPAGRFGGSLYTAGLTPTFIRSTVVSQPGQCYQSNEMSISDREPVKNARLELVPPSRIAVFHRPDPNPGPIPDPDPPDQPPSPLPTPPIPPEPPVRRRQSESYRNACSG